jgi:hypothetical protein
MRRRVFVMGTAAVLAAADALAQTPPPAGGAAPPAPGSGGPKQGMTTWDQQAERTFRMGRGMGRQLMTEEEWKAHQQKMRTLSQEDLAKYRQEVHQKMVERAKEKGIAMPATPGPRGPGPGGAGGGPGRPSN